MNTTLVLQLIVIYGLIKMSLSETTLTFRYFSTHGTGQVMHYQMTPILT